MRPCRIPFPQKLRGSGRVFQLSISVHGLGGLVNVCKQVSNNNQTLGLLREGLSQNLPYLKAAPHFVGDIIAGTIRGQALTTELRGVQSVANSSASSIFHISFD